jgi:hypothetical protein
MTNKKTQDNQVIFKTNKKLYRNQINRYNKIWFSIE